MLPRFGSHRRIAAFGLLTLVGAAALALSANSAAAAVHAQLSWIANAASPQSDLIAPGAQNELYLTLSGVPASGGFKADRTSVQLRTQKEPVTPIVTLSVYNPSWLVGGLHMAIRY